MLIKINNRLQSLPEGLTFKKVKPGHYAAEYNGNSYSIIGGKAAGGAHNEWFLVTNYSAPINTTGLVDSLNLIAQGV